MVLLSQLSILKKLAPPDGTHPHGWMDFVSLGTKKVKKNVTAILTSLLCASRERGMCSPKKSIRQNPLLVHVEVSL